MVYNYIRWVCMLDKREVLINYKRFDFFEKKYNFNCSLSYNGINMGKHHWNSTDNRENISAKNKITKSAQILYEWVKKAVRDTLATVSIATSTLLWSANVARVIPESILKITAPTAGALFVACEKQDTTDPVVTPHKSEVDVTWWKKIDIDLDHNEIRIWGDLVASWYDDMTERCTVTVTLNWKPIWDDTIIKQGWILKISVKDLAWHEKYITINLTVVNKAPEVTVIKPKVDVTWWKKVEVQNNNLLIWGDKIVEWSDDHTQNCTVTLSLNGNDVNFWDTLNEWWTLTIRVINKDWYESIRDINLHISYTDNNYGNIIILEKKPNNTMEVRNWLMHNAYLAADTEIYINNSTSYPTAISTIPFLKLLSIAEENRPWCTREEVIQIMRDNYLILND